MVTTAPWLTAVALLLAAPATSRQRAGDHVTGEYAALCAECYYLAHHAHRLVRAAVTGAPLSRAAWLQEIDAHCANRRAAKAQKHTDLCASILLARHGGALADELSELVADADGDAGDSTVATPAAVAAALCGARSAAALCPANFEVHHAPTDAYAGDPSAIQHAFKNVRPIGAVELHVFDGAAGAACAPTEVDLLEKGYVPRADTVALRILGAGEEKVVALAKRAPRTGDPYDAEETSIRIKPRHAPCGDGFDMYVDFTTQFALYEVADNPAFDPSRPRSNANAPLNVTLRPGLMPHGKYATEGAIPPRRRDARPRTRRRRDL